MHHLQGDNEEQIQALIWPQSWMKSTFLGCRVLTLHVAVAHLSRRSRFVTYSTGMWQESLGGVPPWRRWTSILIFTCLLEVWIKNLALAIEEFLHAHEVMNWSFSRMEVACDLKFLTKFNCSASILVSFALAAIASEMHELILTESTNLPVFSYMQKSICIIFKSPSSQLC